MNAKLETAYGKALAQVCAREMLRFEGGVKEASRESGRSPQAAQERLLALIRSNPGISAEDAASELCITRSRVLATSRKLERQGLIRRTRHYGAGGAHPPMTLEPAQ